MDVISEKVKFNGINTDISPAAVGNDGNRLIVNPIVEAKNVRYFTSEHSDGLIAESIKGTTSIANASLPAGTNVCIGAYEDKQNNIILFHIYNSNADHSIFKYDPITNSVSLIIQKSELDYQDDPRYLITGHGSVGNLYFFTDGYGNQRLINITRDYDYVGFVEADICLIKRQPLNRPVVFPPSGAPGGVMDYYPPAGEATGHPDNREQVGSDVPNTISDKSIQFSYRYIYLDDEKSNLAPYSIMAYAEAYPKKDLLEHNAISLRIPLFNGIQFVVKKLELLYREGNIGTWKVFESVTPPSSTEYDTYFLGDTFISEVAESESSKISESIPNFSKALCLQKNRIFLSDDESGFDWDGTLTPEIASILVVGTKPVEIGSTNRPYWKSEGKYRFCINLFDGLLRSIGSVGISEISMPKYYPRQEPDTFGPTTFFGVLSYYGSVRVIAHGDSPVASPGAASITFYVESEFIRTLLILSNNSNATMLLRKISAYNKYGGWMRGLITAYTNDPNTFYQQITINFTDFGGSGSTTLWALYHVNSELNPTAAPATPFNFVQFGNRLDISLQGTTGTNRAAKYYSLGVSDNLNVQEFEQAWVIPFFYRADQGSWAFSTSDKFAVDEKVFVKPFINESSQPWAKLYLMIPKEMSVTLTTDWYVKILDGSPVRDQVLIGRVEKILAIVGDFVVVNNFGYLNWNAVTVSNQTEYRPPNKLYVEFFLPPESQSVNTIYREISDRYKIYDNGTIEKTLFLDVLGDVYFRSARNTYRGVSGAPTEYDQTIREGGFLIKETPSPTTITNGSYTMTEYDDKVISYKQFIDDYSKKAISRGIPFVEIEKSNRVSTSKTRIRFSNAFIQDTFINGLNSFDASNSYSVGSERGQIKKFVPIGSNIILAVHDRAATSLSIGEGIIRSADGQESLSITTDVIGHDRKLIYEFGSYHAESVQEHEGKAFGFDVFKGVVWKYTAEGQHPISNYGKESEFRALGQEYLPIKDTCKIIGGIDPFNREYILTFRKADGSGVTWSFNFDENRWLCNYDYKAEMYCKLGTSLFSFKDGALWKHNSSSVHNNFHGVQYERSIKVAVNPYPSKKKVLNGIEISAALLSDDNDEKIVKVYTPEGQESYIRFDEFDVKEGIHKATFLRDINSPNIEAGQIALRDGDEMRSDYFLVEVVTSLTDRAPIKFFNVNYNTSEFSQ